MGERTLLGSRGNGRGPWQIGLLLLILLVAGDPAIGGPARPRDTVVYETNVPNRPATDCNQNGLGDRSDVATQVASDRNHNGWPDECETDSSFAAQGILSPPQRSTGSSDLDVRYEPAERRLRLRYCLPRGMHHARVVATPIRSSNYVVLSTASLGQGVHEITWSAPDSAGRPAVSGHWQVALVVDDEIHYRPVAWNWSTVSEFHR